jgi:hypothetical protein
VVVPATRELRLRRLHLFNQLRGIDLLGLVSPGLVTGMGSAPRRVLVVFSGHVGIESRTTDRL